MHLRSLISTAAVVSGLAAASLAASAAVNFNGPSGWRHIEQPSTSTSVKVDEWKLSGDDTQALTVMQDSTTSYSDALTLMHNNFVNIHIKPAIDKDQTCQGKQGHVVEFTYGPDGHQTVWDRTLIPDGSGVVTITYQRASDQTMDPDVKKAIETFCASSS